MWTSNKYISWNSPLVTSRNSYENKRSVWQQMNEVCFLLVKMPNFVLFGGRKHILNFLFFSRLHFDTVLWNLSPEKFDKI